MKSAACKTSLVAVLLCGTLLASGSAHALRCSGKVIREGMLQLEIREHCGEPAAVRERGFAVRAFTPFELMRSRDAQGVRFEAGNFYQHLLVTEFIYNFGPSRLMRKLRFEGGLLTDIETLGYGYIED